MSALRLLVESRVAPEEIDHLGHMNVRFYLDKALRATAELAARLGLGPDACRERGARLELRDVFTRHRREQLVGAPLAVRGGVLAVRADGLRFYHELVNTARGEVAATYVHELQLVARDTRRPIPLPEAVARSAGRARVEWPEHGRPRTLDLARVPAGLALSEARARGLEMRRERVIRPEECDAAGFFAAARYQELVWGGEPLGSHADWMPFFELEGGGKLGWATLESRGILLELPRAGSRIQSFGAEVELGRKTSLRHHWVFDLDREALLCASSILNLAFDLGARRAAEIPAALRERLESEYHPDLR
jgi:acyl-CoA thioester hydrolase